MTSTLQTATPKAIGYVRVSTDKQELSLDAQTARIRAMASLQGLTLVDVVVEAESAKTLDRPGLQAVLALVDSRSVSTVIVAKLDRLTRSVKDLATLLETFERRDVSLVSVSESLDTRSAAGRLVLNVMMSVAQWEREAIGERTREALRHKKAQGQRVGELPFGSTVAPDGKTLVPHAGEQHTLTLIRSAHARGRSLRQIAATLNAQGLTTRTGGVWRFQYVARILAA